MHSAHFDNTEQPSTLQHTTVLNVRVVALAIGRNRAIVIHCMVNISMALDKKVVLPSQTLLPHHISHPEVCHMAVGSGYARLV